MKKTASARKGLAVFSFKWTGSMVGLISEQTVST
jgi:hypothetical protein